ncbi:MAG: amino acid permease [Bacillota bacterium]
MVSNTGTLNPLEIQPFRNLSFWHIWALGVGAVVGDGIFLYIGYAIELAGPASIIAFLVAGIFQLFLMMALVELAVGMPSAGAMGTWVERFMGPWWGYLAGFCWAFAWVIVGGAVSLALGRFLSYYFPVHELILAGIAITIFALLNIFGGLVAASTQLWMTLGIVGIMAALAIFGLPEALKGFPENFVPFLPYGFKGMMLALPIGAYAYMGTACLCTAGSECKSIKDLPRGLIWASVTFIILYTFAKFVVLGIVPWDQLSMVESIYVTAAERVFGGVAAGVVNFGAILAAATCLLMGTLYSASRIFFDEARKGMMPAIFGYLHPKYRTPVWGISIIWIFNIAWIIIAYWNTDFVYITLTMQFVVAAFISYGLSIAAAIMYRKRFPDEVGKLPFRMPVPVLTFTLAIGGTAITAYYTLYGSPQVIPLSLVWIIPLYLWYRCRAKLIKTDVHTGS